MEPDKLILSSSLRRSRQASTSPAINPKTQAVPTPNKTTIVLNPLGYTYKTGMTRI